MKHLRNSIIALILVFTLLAFVSADNTNCKLSPTLLSQDPEPAMPGEYVDLVFQLSGTDNSKCNGASFKLIEKFPFSLDPSVESKKEISGSTFINNFQKVWNIPYKVRVSPDALDGENELEIQYSEGGSPEEAYFSKRFNISVEDVRTEFEVFVKDYDSSNKEITFEILNIGENDVEALTIEIVNQDNFQLKGSPRNIVGSLDSNEETTFDFKGIPEMGEIELKIIYTDSINKRRTTNTEVYFEPEYFKSGDEKGKTSIWFYLSALLIVFIAGRWFWKKHKTKK